MSTETVTHPGEHDDRGPEAAAIPEVGKVSSDLSAATAEAEVREPRSTSTTEALEPRTTAADGFFAVMRVAIGWVFLWAFLDKLFGLGYTTPSGQAWIHGGSPTKGFLSHVAAGPMMSTYHSWAGQTWVDWLFMLGLAAIGVAVILGLAMRLAAAAGTVMMAFMWLAEFPPARHGLQGLTQSTNPIVDYHVIYAMALIAVAIVGAGRTWGLGRLWAKIPFVRDHYAVLQ